VAQAIEVAAGIDAGIAKLARIIADFQKRIIVLHGKVAVGAAELVRRRATPSTWPLRRDRCGDVVKPLKLQNILPVVRQSLFAPRNLKFLLRQSVRQMRAGFLKPFL
jgi:hypothetical protein